MTQSVELSVALFVEGTSHSSSTARDGDPLVSLWNSILATRAGVLQFDHIIGISKKHLVAMESDVRTLSGAGEALDQLIERQRSRLGFDAAVVAWDMHPKWNTAPNYCRWEETLRLYRGLAGSSVLGQEWIDCAASRLAELEGRSSPSARANPPRLAHSMVLGLCMDPMFESILTIDERALRNLLGLSGRFKGAWKGFAADARQIDADIGKAIDAARRVNRQAPVFKRVRQSFREAKHEWAAEILKHLSGDASTGLLVEEHPIVQRLQEVARR